MTVRNIIVKKCIVDIIRFIFQERLIGSFCHPLLNHFCSAYHRLRAQLQTGHRFTLRYRSIFLAFQGSWKPESIIGSLHFQLLADGYLKNYSFYHSNLTLYFVLLCDNKQSHPRIWSNLSLTRLIRALFLSINVCVTLPFSAQWVRKSSLICNADSLVRSRALQFCLLAARCRNICRNWSSLSLDGLYCLRNFHST